MKLVGVTIVRNEEDILPVSLNYHLAQGMDALLVADNGSTDRTPEVLRRLARDPRIRCTQVDGAFRQTAVANDLIRRAHQLGADWVLVFDADEFWHAPGTCLRAVLEESRAGALRVEITHFVQRRCQRRNRPDSLLHMVYRAQTGSTDDPVSAVESGAISFLEAPFPPKWIFRPAADFMASKGVHDVEGVNGPKEDTRAIVCLHAPVRSREQLEVKAANGKRHLEAGVKPGESWQTLRWMRLAEGEALEAEWAAISQRHGVLDVYGRKQRLIRDTRLRDLVRPFIPRPWRWLG